MVQCLCNHATLFGSNFFVAPNKLDVAKQFANLGNIADYPALLATICVIGGLYLIGMIWALRKDRKKTCKVSDTFIRTVVSYVQCFQVYHPVLTHTGNV